MCESIVHLTRVRQEHTRVPIKLATFHEHLGKLAFRFLSKRLHLIDVGLTAQVAHLDISVARLRSCRYDADSQQYVVSRYVAQTNLHAIQESFFVHHQLVRWRDNDVGIGICSPNAYVCPGYTGCCIAVDGFHQDVVFAYLWHLFENHWQILLTCTYIYILLGYHLAEPVEGLLQLCTARSKEVQELLRTVCATAGP